MFKYFSKNYKFKKAFTLIELLVVIAIIGILATLAVVALQQARSRARDSKRIADIKQAQTALELFFNEQGRYPTEEEWLSGSLITSSGQVLMYNIPSAPYPADGVCDASQNNFYYQVSEDNSTYTLSFCLGNDVSNLSEGLKCATPGGIMNYDCLGDNSGGDNNGGGDEPGDQNNSGEETNNSFDLIDSQYLCEPSCNNGYVCQGGECVVDSLNCGQSIVYNGYNYKTVVIGNQCWLAENLRTDKFRNGDSITNQAGSWSNLNYPVWTFYEDNSSYASYGKLYSMLAVSDPRRICPPGWRVPFYSDFVELNNSIGSNNSLTLKSCRMVDSSLGGVCNVSDHPRWDNSSSVGTNYFNFSILPSGIKTTNFSYIGTRANFWTLSIATLSTTRYYILTNTDVNPIYNNAYDYSGISVRCIKGEDFPAISLPTVSTESATNLTANVATLNGQVTANGGGTVYARGIIWADHNNLEYISNNVNIIRITNHNSVFSKTIDILHPNTTYYFRAYAVNEKGISYGNVVAFTTLLN